eukprot:336838-Lingulodinium_polyedra.AAC.1
MAVQHCASSSDLVESDARFAVLASKYLKWKDGAHRMLLLRDARDRRDFQRSRELLRDWQCFNCNHGDYARCERCMQCQVCGCPCQGDGRATGRPRLRSPKTSSASYAS